MTGGNPEILARGYVVDAMTRHRHEMYFSRHEYHIPDMDDNRVSFEAIDEDRNVVWSISFNEPSKLES